MNTRFAREHLGGQLCTTVEYPTHSFASQTIIVTGSNTGMGLEAARHFVRLDAAKVILAVRSVEKGQKAAADIVNSTGRKGVVEVWELDLARFDSVKAFAQRALALERLDVLVANAGIFMFDWSEAEGSEATVTVNVVSHMLLVMLVLPKMRETAERVGSAGRIVFCGSFTHWMTKFPERKEENILEGLDDKGKARMRDRYYVSKLIQLLVGRELAAELEKSTKPGRIAASVSNPGFCKTEIMRHGSALFELYMKFMRKSLARTAEEGGRTLVLPASADETSNGQYYDSGKIGMPSDWVLSEEGMQTQKKLWGELTARLEKIHPGVMQNL
ncbi:putative short-chain dehydrogenase/reductase family protein [Cercophora newfieldiana]|uniref:Short-chain dehydrogenase/reductase family protein n=1 Tax=Cercophora newfieldiana TaxID=92897 RepID=A0AA39XZG9_9PEZI|nr:putative short-chain dehydrogenase/reductase family protein [Cercophora newfieldiana]